MFGFSSPLVWVLVVLSFLPGAYLYFQSKGKARIAFKSLAIPGVALAILLPIGLAFVAEQWFSQGAKVLELLPFLIGAIGASAAALLSNWTESDQAGDAALAATGSTVLLTLTQQEGPLAALTAFSALLGVASATLAWHYVGCRRVSMQTLLGSAAFIVLSGLCFYRKEVNVWAVPMGLGLIGAATGIFGLAVDGLKEKMKGFGGVAATVILAIISAGIVVFAPGTPLAQAAILLAAASVLAVLLDFAMPEGCEYKGVSAILWLGLGTYGFSQQQGLGVAVAAFGAIVALSAAKRSDLLAGVSPLLAFAIYRLFMEGSEGARAFDIGQHYAMIGLILGVLSVQAVITFLKGIEFQTSKHLILGTLSAVFLGSILVGGGLLLQDKGIVGIMIGSLLPGVFALKDDKENQISLSSAGLGVGAATLMALAFRALLPSLDLTRDAKQTALLIFAAAAFGSVAAIFFLSRSKGETAHV